MIYLKPSLLSYFFPLFLDMIFILLTINYDLLRFTGNIYGALLSDIDNKRKWNPSWIFLPIQKWLIKWLFIFHVVSEISEGKDSLQRKNIESWKGLISSFTYMFIQFCIVKGTHIKLNNYRFTAKQSTWEGHACTSTHAQISKQAKTRKKIYRLSLQSYTVYIN